MCRRINLLDHPQYTYLFIQLHLFETGQEYPAEKRIKPGWQIVEHAIRTEIEWIVIEVNYTS